MNYRKAMSKKEVISIVDGVKRHGENVSVKEDFGGESEFMRHLRVDEQSRSIAGKTYDGRIALVSRKSDGDHVKYTSDVITKPSNLVKAMKRGLSFEKLKKGRNTGKHGKHSTTQGKHSTTQGKHSTTQGKHSTTQGKHATKRGKSIRRQGSRTAKQGKHSAKKGKSGRKHGKSGRKHGKSSGKKRGKTKRKGKPSIKHGKSS